VMWYDEVLDVLDDAAFAREEARAADMD